VYASPIALDRIVMQLAREPQTAAQVAAAIHLSFSTVNPVIGALREGVIPYQRVRVREWLRPEGPRGRRTPVYEFSAQADNTHRRTTPAEHHRRRKEKLAGLFAARKRGPATPFDGLMQ
jgi:hypothetical protein